MTVVLEIIGDTGQSFLLTLSQRWTQRIFNAEAGDWSCLTGLLQATKGYFDSSALAGGLFIWDKEPAISKDRITNDAKLFGFLEGADLQDFWFRGVSSGRGSIYQFGKAGATIQIRRCGSSSNYLEAEHGCASSIVTWKLLQFA